MSKSKPKYSQRGIELSSRGKNGTPYRKGWTIFEVRNMQVCIISCHLLNTLTTSIRDYPGRLVLYPLMAATCTVIFFGGDWNDAGVAAVCGIACGLT